MTTESAQCAICNYVWHFVQPIDIKAMKCVCEGMLKAVLQPLERQLALDSLWVGVQLPKGYKEPPEPVTRRLVRPKESVRANVRGPMSAEQKEKIRQSALARWSKYRAEKGT